MISHVEHGRSALLIEGAVKAAQTLGVSLDYLTGLTDDPTPAAQLAEQVDTGKQVRELGNQVAQRYLTLRHPQTFGKPGVADDPHQMQELEQKLYQAASELVVLERGQPELRSGDVRARVSQLESAGPEPLRRVTCPYARGVLAAAGDGLPVFDESAELGIAIAPSALAPWARPDAVVFMRAAGESTLPGIRDGDLLAVDSSRVEPVGGQVFVLRTDAGTVVKRLRHRRDRWHLFSDNEAYEPRPVGEDDCIVGQVAWVGPPSATEHVER